MWDRWCPLHPGPGMALSITRAMVLVLALVPGCGAVAAQDGPNMRAPQQASVQERRRQGLPLDGDITRPVVLYTADPEFSEEARRMKLNGDVLLKLKLDNQGKVTDVTVVRGVGHGLDEKAVEAARKYRFTAATQDGKPIPWELNVEFTFRIR